jgi:hypothetical protein
MLDGQADPPPDRNPSCVAAEESGRRLARAVLESMDAIKLDAVVYPSWNNPLTDRRPQFALKRSLSRAEPKVRIQLPPAESPRTIGSSSCAATKAILST